MFLLVPAYPGCPGSKAVKRSLFPQCFDAVGWASGRESGMYVSGCMCEGGLSVVPGSSRAVVNYGKPLHHYNTGDDNGAVSFTLVNIDVG